MNDSTPLAESPSDPGQTPAFAQLAASLTTSTAAIDPARVVELTLRAVRRADHAALTLLRSGRAPVTVAASGAVPRFLDRLQHEVDEGPLLETAPDHGVVLVDDLLADPRWPDFGPQAGSTAGVRSMLCLHLVLGGTDRAALSVYASAPGALAEPDVASASLIAPFAALAAEAHLRAHDVDNLTAALESSRQIGTAVGIVMARHGMTSDEAFALLRKASMDLNRKVHDVAAEVEHTGLVPGHGSSDPGSPVGDVPARSERD